MTISLRKIVLNCLLLCFASQSLAVQGMAFQGLGSSPVMVICHSDKLVQAADIDLQDQHSNRHTEHSQTRSNCCSADCDMGSCFTALLPTYYPLHSFRFPVSETIYAARLSDRQTTSLFRPPITI